MALSSVRDLMQAFVTRNNSSTSFNPLMQIGQEWSCYAMIPVMVATLEGAVACTTVFVQLLKSLLLFVNIEWFQDSTVATCQGHCGSCGSHDSQLLLSLRWQLSIASLSASLLPPFCCLYCLWNDCFEIFLHTSSSHRSTAISQEKTTQEKPFIKPNVATLEKGASQGSNQANGTNYWRSQRGEFAAVTANLSPKWRFVFTPILSSCLYQP